jgi:hypothetical protein
MLSSLADKYWNNRIQMRNTEAKVESLGRVDGMKSEIGLCIRTEICGKGERKKRGSSIQERPGGRGDRG